MDTQQSSTSVPTLFTRNATGLVRELSGFDAFNLVFSAVLIPVGITQVMGFVLVIMGLAFIIVSIAAGSVPYRRAAMHADAPGWAHTRVLGVPVITLVALVSGLSWAFVIYAALHTGFGGKLGWGPMIKVFIAPIIAVVWYIGVSIYRRSQEIALANTFKEIPPE